ncbi:MAG TPA: PfkB family carbohydrate kinase, partial [Mycobacterium sp.]|nr:PfkB family carbohydrate kinase [Mycobacterium sp.]
GRPAAGAAGVSGGDSWPLASGPRLISVGNAIIDVTAWVPALPERGGDVLARSSGLSVGGSGFNVLVTAVRQGLAVRFGGAHGTGPFGELVRAALQRAGIGVLLPPVPDVDTGFDIALTDAGGERTFVTAVGAEAQLTVDRLATVTVAPGDLVHVSGYALVHSPSRDAIADWLRRLPSECVVLVDPGPLWRSIPDPVLAAVRRRATWWSCNLAEAADAPQVPAGADRAVGAGSGGPASGGRASASPAPASGGPAPAGPTVTSPTPASAGPISTGIEAAHRLAVASQTEGGPGMGVVVRLGADGCVILAPGGEPVHVPGFAVEALDTNGAGDAHVGAFLAALAAGQHPLAAARRANACAALAVTRPGPATAPTAAEVDALLASGA